MVSGGGDELTNKMKEEMRKRERERSGGPGSEMSVYNEVIKSNKNITASVVLNRLWSDERHSKSENE